MRLALALAVVLALPGQALAAETSPGVSLVGSIPERGVISAKAVGGYLYVSALTGVSIYDIGNPRAPVRVGRLELPNAQNEDVDVGSGIMLVSDDPFGGRGVLHVIDVRDPANPALLSSFRTWTPGLFNFTRPPRRRGIGHTASCIQECRYAWLAGSSEGIDVVDLRDPAHPRLAGRFAAREAAGPIGTHDVQVDGSGLAWVAGGNGTAAYDVSNPVRPRLVKRTSRRRGRGLHHNSLRLGNVLAVTEEDFGPGCRGAGRLEMWRITARRRMTRLDSFGVERDRSSSLLCSAHYFDARDGLIAQGFYEQGVRLIDVRRPGRLRQVGYYVQRPGLVWGALFAPTDPTGSTVYALDHSRGIDVLALDRAALQPVRRSGSRPRGVPKDFGLFIDDGLDVVRPGRRLRLQIFAFGQGGRADVQVTLPAELVDVRPPRGVSYDPATRTLRFTFRRLGDRGVRARVARSASPGTQLETIGYVSGAGDLLPLNDRGVDRSVVGRRAVAAAAARPWLCALP
jgi:LVIVD repeat-containing protein